MNQELQTYIGAQIPELATSLQKSIKDLSSVVVPYNDIVYWLSDFAVTANKTNFALSKTRPDFEQIKQQFIARLRQRDSWRDLIQAGVGETLLEFVAAVGDYGQTSILRAYQETSYDARLTSSVYTITRFLGVHIDRKIPAETIVNLYGEDGDELHNLPIPSFSQFQINGIPFFNRETIVFNNNTVDTPLEVKLYQGQITVEFFTSYGTPFQTLEIGNNDYKVADEDVYCFVNDRDTFKRTTEGLWHYEESDKVFFEQTTPNGNVEILFGNSVYGAIPGINETITFIYALTEGDAANSTTPNQQVDLVDLNTSVPDRIKNADPEKLDAILTETVTKVRGVTKTPIYNGGSEKTKDFYATLGPGIRASNKRMVTRPDHRAQAMRFPNIADVLLQGQRELARYKIGWTNVCGVTAIKKDGTLLTDDEWKAYEEYLISLEIWRVDFKRLDPEPVYIDFSGDIYCTQSSDLTNIKTFIESNVREFFRPKLGIIGKSVFENDAETLYKFEYGNSRVDYVQNVKPTQDNILRKYGFSPQYPVLRNYNCNAFYSTRSYPSVSPKVIGTV